MLMAVKIYPVPLEKELEILSKLKLDKKNDYSMIFIK